MKFSTLICAFTAVCGAMSMADLSAAATEQVAGHINWMTDFDAAKKQAQEQSKPMFVYFTGSDWCPWCKKMDAQILSTPEFQQAMADKVVFVKIDFPRSTKLDATVEAQNKKLSSQYGITGFPTAALLDSNGNVISKMGFENGGGANYAKKVQAALDAYSKK